ncbi:hypothetical protein [Olleya sp. HaHaR_3_96]|uniref:hypothetical protein n=1 Tax=Olleya sp. HaHaR_3_96 TaxID=2745560 RepID=UPI001C501DA2|nr:hypothetical protein [Olleya sp. HaHaR_3_96]QXP59787.1 hypothetical protein H0I26_18050 [Olleya sp. HaHaR_3_96]
MLNRLLFISIALLFFSCGNEKVLQLPEIQNATITEILDVSPAYIFYDETKQDSVELNRKNLIISTNWLVNVDKRLTLEQALPSIIKLQEKKRNATMHKNEKARNYYTCNDTSIKNLGFIDFTDIVYVIKKGENHSTKNLKPINEKEFKTEHVPNNGIYEHVHQIVDIYFDKNHIISSNKALLNEGNLPKYLRNLALTGNGYFIDLKVNFSKNLTFQEYITFKIIISTLESETISISNNEFIY